MLKVITGGGDPLHTHYGILIKKISQTDKGVEEMENGTTTFCWFLSSTPRYKYGKGQCSNAQTFTEVLLTAPNGS